MKLIVKMGDANKFLAEMKEKSSPEISSRWAKVEEYYNKKLWHQLTKMIQTIIKEPSMQVQYLNFRIL